MNTAAGEGVDANPVLLFIPPWFELFWALFFLIVFAVIFIKLVLPKMTAVLDERAERIEGGLEKAEQAQQEADRLKETQEQELAAARREAAEIRENARQEGARIIDEAKSRAGLESERVLGAGRQQLEAERTQASAQLRGDVGSLASTLASKIVGEALTDDERSRRVIDRFLDDLESSSATTK
ncbi:MAG: F0F1 ATP synthase subunit B [Dermabacter sp.]|nr:F0F1 ATP synthase subunit B [Dermabacter sp.]